MMGIELATHRLEDSTSDFDWTVQNQNWDEVGSVPLVLDGVGLLRQLDQVLVLVVVSWFSVLTVS